MASGSKGNFFPTFSDRHSRLCTTRRGGTRSCRRPGGGRRFAHRKAFRRGGCDSPCRFGEGADARRANLGIAGGRRRAATRSALPLPSPISIWCRGQANLPTFATQRAHVLSPVHQKLTSLKEVVGQPAVRAIERELDGRCFMLGFLDRPLTEKNRGPVSEMLRLLDFLRSCHRPDHPQRRFPSLRHRGASSSQYRRRQATSIVGGMRSSIPAFRQHPDGALGEVKALNRRVVLEIDGCEYKDLRPVADFVARLSDVDHQIS